MIFVLGTVRASLSSSFFFFSKHMKCHLPTVLEIQLHYCSCLFFVKNQNNCMEDSFGEFFSFFLQTNIAIDTICPCFSHGSIGIEVIEFFSHIRSSKRCLLFLKRDCLCVSYQSHLLLLVMVYTYTFWYLLSGDLKRSFISVSLSPFSPKRLILI